MSQTNLSGDNAAVSVLSLANEIMMMIFNLVCKDSQFVLQTHGFKFKVENDHVSDDDDYAPKIDTKYRYNVSYSDDDSHTPKINAKDSSYGAGQEVVLSHVCQAWRAISLDCPELWVNFNHYEQYRPEHLENRLKTYLERTGTTRCLNFWFCVSSADEFNLVMDRIMPYASRWRRLSLTCDLRDRLGPQWDGMRILPSKTQTEQTVSFDNLEMLDMYLPDYISDPSNVFSAMGMGRKLSALRTTQLLIDQIPLQHLSVLYIDYTEEETDDNKISTFISILTDIPNLTTLSLTGNVFHGDFFTDVFKDSEPIIVPNLRYFKCSSDCTIKFVWKAFSAPQLEILILCDIVINQDRLPMSTTPRSPTAKMFPSLRTLVLTDCPLDEERESDCLLPLARATPNISELIFSHTILDDSPALLNGETILEYLSSAPLTDEMQSIWPDLTKLTYLPIPSEYSAMKSLRYPGGLMKRLYHRAMFSSQGCKLRIPEYFMHGWKEGIPRRWERYDIEEICEALPDILRDSDPRDWIPWPPKSKVEFHRTQQTKPYSREW